MATARRDGPSYGSGGPKVVPPRSRWTPPTLATPVRHHPGW
ncbi:hypothetical protein HMPREF0591_3050 [Mycobacterium parascrofulaceum ATCC BAA-614]|uniref:Uncharacterized protein n=1 Tax=Mycobacterium parascrofulaceum ATCC BAA-614 TaxID=525368 RepID=D5PA56_9MYCO|nr:hypothetical protein HMPREF0591_3050 [Mycobacterium parascrofulaceum ATCC BAA-614]